MREKTMGGLQVRIAGGPNRTGDGDGPVVVLLHGFGAPGDDLVPLWRVLNVPEGTRFIFPAAPLSLDGGFGESRAWWMLDMERLAQERARGNWTQLVKEVPDGLSMARQKVTDLLEIVKQEFQVTPEEIVLGGFSQGAMLACDTVLRSNQSFAGLVMLSGSLIAKDEWAACLPNRKGMGVFQSHGTDDPILSPVVAQQLRDMFIAEGLFVEWHEFRGGHEIPMDVLTKLGEFIQGVLYKNIE